MLQRTKHFDRIGPIKIPSEIDGVVHQLYLFYYVFYRSQRQYFLITRNHDLVFTQPFLRVSSNCFFSYIVNSRRCDCKWQLNYAYEQLARQSDDDFLVIFAVDEHGKAIEGGLRGHALLYALGQELGQELILEAYQRNGFEPDSRDYRDICLILESLSVANLRLLTNNPDRVKSFKDNGYFVQRVAIEQPYDKYLSEELGVKKQKLGHELKLDGFSEEDIEVYNLSKNSLKPGAS